jgi:hypothetical protein
VPPLNDGGCRVISYVVLRDDGLGGDIETEVNSTEDPAVRNLPSLNQLTVTNFPDSSLGYTFRFQIKVITTQQEALSSVNYIVLASEPLKPIDIPVYDPEITNDYRIKVTFASTVPDNGGSPIISYDLAMDDGRTGNFTSLVGFRSNSLLTEFTIDDAELIIKGR